MFRSKFALAAGLLTIVSLRADAQKSNTSGFLLGLYLNGVSITRPEAAGANNEGESGAGLGARLGWGFTPKLTGFVGLHSAALDFKGDAAALEDPYGLAHLDLGLTYNFGSSSTALRPYVEVALSTRAIVTEQDLGGGSDQKYEQTGGGLTIGGGINYFFSRSAAFNVGLMITGGSFEDGEVDGTEIPDTGGSATSMRLNLGLTWYPMKK